MTAQVEEIVPDTHLLKLEDLRPDVRENCFDGVTWRDKGIV